MHSNVFLITKCNLIIGLTAILLLAVWLPLPAQDSVPTPLDGENVPKYVEPLPTFVGTRVDASGGALTISMKELSEQILPAPNPALGITGYPQTTVWGYEINDGTTTFPAHYPAYTIEARRGIPVTVTYYNKLGNQTLYTPGSASSPGILPIDQTLHWADPLNTGHTMSTYAGPVSEQGVGVARMRWADRDSPAGKVGKWHQGKWAEPGIGGHATIIFPAFIYWHHEDANSFWGPSIHWNTHLRQYVILLNRSMDSRWTQEGIYVSFNPDLANPGGWSAPRRILDATGNDRWYPQVIGLDASKRETDKLAGRDARLFIRGQFRWGLEPGGRGMVSEKSRPDSLVARTIYESR